MKEDFLNKIDRNLESMGFGDRSNFIRKAVEEKLERHKIYVDKSESAPPSRAGKGGRPKKAKEVEAGADTRIPKARSKLETVQLNDDQKEYKVKRKKA